MYRCNSCRVVHLAEDGAMTKYEGEASSSNIEGVQLKISLKCIWSVADVEARSLTMHDWLTFQWLEIRARQVQGERCGAM